MTTGRLELKYCVSESIAVRVLDIARAYLLPEPFASGPRQRVTSLYLDTPDFQFLRWHHERAADRLKLRIRRYGELPPHVLYSEVKRKTRSVVRKERTAFVADELPAVIASSRATWGAAPYALVTGMRESLRDPQGVVAVTVDRALQYQPVSYADLQGRATEWRRLPLPRSNAVDPVLLELKHGFDTPDWMLPLINTLAPARVSFSKYAAAMVDGTRAGRECTRTSSPSGTSLPLP
jgi:hypothetical protein